LFGIRVGIGSRGVVLWGLGLGGVIIYGHRLHKALHTVTGDGGCDFCGALQGTRGYDGARLLCF